MKRREAFDEIERMFRSYHLWRLRLAAMEPKLVSRHGLPSAPREGAIRRPTEDFAIDRADLRTQIRLIEIIFNAMTNDEKRFIKLRYFSDLPMKVIWREMRGWSQRQLYRLRLSVLVKAAWIMKNGA